MGPMSDSRARLLVLAAAALLASCAPGGLVLGASGEVRSENRIEQELGRAVRPAPERFASQDTMAWQFVAPLMESARRSIADGRLPLWEPSIGTGFPVWASGSAGVLSPLKLPFWLLGAPLGESAWVLLKLLLSGVFAFLFCRRLRFGVAASLLGGIAFGACGYSVCYAAFEHDPVVFLPLALWATDRLLESGGAARIATSAACTGMALGSGHPVLGALVLVAQGTWVACRLPGLRVRLAVVGRQAAATVLALALSAAVLVPFVEFVHNGWSYKLASDREVPEATVERTPAFGLRRAASAAVPHLVEAWRGADVPGGAGLFRRVATHEGPQPQYRSFLYAYGTWVGVVPLLLAGLVVFRRRGWRHPLVPFTILPALVLFAFPGMDLLARVPLASALLPRWFASWFCLGVACLGAAGLDDVLREPARASRRLGVAAIAYALLAVATTTAVVLVAGDTAPEWGPAPTLADVLDRLWVPIGIAALCPLAAILERADAGRLGVVLVALVALDLGVNGAWIPGSPPRDPAAPADLAERLHLPADVPARVAALGSTIMPDTALYYGLNDVQAIVPLFVERYRRFMEVAVPDLRELYPNAAVAREPNAWLDLASVSAYLVPSSWNFGRASPDAQYEGPAVRVLARPESLPRAYVARRARAAHGLAAAEAMLREDPAARRNLPVVEPGDRDGPWSESILGRDAQAPAAASITGYGPVEVTVDVAGLGPGLLVLTDAHYPGWIAEVDGESAAIVPVNVAFRGVVLPDSARRVVFSYRPASLALGLAGSLLTALGLAVAVFIERRRARIAPIPGRNEGTQ